MSDGYRIRSDQTWAKAAADYQAGEDAPSVCARYDLGLSAFRKRAREEGWRRSDQPDPPAFEEVDEELPLRPVHLQVAECLTRADVCLQRGRPAEAQRYLALARDLRRFALEAAAEERRDANAACADIKRSADTLTAVLKAGIAADQAQSAALVDGREVTEVHEVHAKIADLEQRILKRRQFGVPAADLRRELKRLRAETPP